MLGVPMPIRRLLSPWRSRSEVRQEGLAAAGLALRLLDEMAVPTFVLDAENRVIIWNRACAHLTGLKASAMVGTKEHWKGFYSAPRPCLADLALAGNTAEIGAHYAAHDAVGGAGLKAENWCDLPNGSRVYLTIEACPLRDATGAVVAVVETLQDSTAREAEQTRARTQAEALDHERAGVLEAFGAALDKLAAGDLTVRIRARLPLVYDKLRTDFNAAIDKLTTVVEGVVASSRALQVGTSEISAASEDLSRRTERQASNLQETASALGEITDTVRKTADMSKHASEVAAVTRGASHEGAKSVRQVVDAMQKIERSSQQIGRIIGVIDEIAFQTNLLALNAGVEAARAGDTGRGFAVVASEVRALAQRSADAAREIKGLIEASSRQVQDGVVLVAETGKAFDQIEVGVKDITEAVEQISKSAEREATELHDVYSTVGQLDQVTQKNAAMSEAAFAASRSLAEQGERLARLIEKFQIERPPDGPLEWSPKETSPRPVRVAEAPTLDSMRRVRTREPASRVATARGAERRSAAAANDYGLTDS